MGNRPAAITIGFALKFSNAIEQLRNNNNQEIDLDYQLHDSIVAEKWFKKIKHLKNIPINEIESELCDVSDLKQSIMSFVFSLELTL